MAAACAEYLRADRLIYLTDVAGVLDGDKVLSAVTWEEIERLVQSHVISGGMVLKLEAASAPWKAAVREVHIVGGGSPDSLLRVRKRSTPHRMIPRAQFPEHAFCGNPCSPHKQRSRRHDARANQKKAIARAVQTSKHSRLPKPKLDTRLSDADQFLLPTYKRQPFVLTHGHGRLCV